MSEQQVIIDKNKLKYNVTGFVPLYNCVHSQSILSITWNAMFKRYPVYSRCFAKVEIESGNEVEQHSKENGEYYLIASNLKVNDISSDDEKVSFDSGFYTKDNHETNAGKIFCKGETHQFNNEYARPNIYPTKEDAIKYAHCKETVKVYKKDKT